MNCREFQELMIDVAFGEAERSTGFDRHLDGCAVCKRDFAATEFAATGIAAAPPPPAPSLSNERLHQAILSTNLRARPSWLPRLSFAGAAAALAFAAWMSFSQDQDSRRPEDVAVVTEDAPRSSNEASGAIEIPEATPDIVAPTVAPATTVKAAAPTRTPRRTRRQAPRTVIATETEAVIPDDLLAVVVGGAESALDGDFSATPDGQSPMSEATAPGPAPESIEEKPIVVIQDRGRATERSSDDVPIGG